MGLKLNLSALTIAALLPLAAQAATLPVAVASGNAADRTLLNATTRGGDTATSFALGESAVDTSDYRAYIPFALSGNDVLDLANAGSTVTLFVNLGVVQNATGSTFSLVGLTGRGAAVVNNAPSAGITGSTADYSTAPSQVLLSGLVAAQTGFTLDVTAYVKAQAGNNTAIAFRLQGDNVARVDSLQNSLTFSSGDNATVANRPTLTIAVPEPTSLAAVGLIGGLLLRRRRAM